MITFHFHSSLVCGVLSDNFTKTLHIFFQLISRMVNLRLLRINGKIFTDHFVTARVDSGIAFSIKFLSSEFLGFRKTLQQDAMSSSENRRNVQKHVWDLIFSHMLISSIHKSIITDYWHAFPGMFLKPFKKLPARVLLGLKPLSCLS